MFMWALTCNLSVSLLLVWAYTGAYLSYPGDGSIKSKRRGTKPLRTDVISKFSGTIVFNLICNNNCVRFMLMLPLSHAQLFTAELIRSF